MNSEPSDFSKYLVIFIDILGSKNRNNFKEAYKINKIFHEELLKNQKRDKEYTKYFRKIYSFSDCAYIFYGFKDAADKENDLGKLFTVALCNCEPIFLRFVKEKIIFRGGICYGDAYVDLNSNENILFFGPAVNKAYEIESKIAVHPRIVIDSELAEKVKECIDEVKMKLATELENVYLGMGLMPKIPETGDGIIEEDTDKKYIYNYLHFPENNMQLGDYYTSGKEFIEELRGYCNDQIKDSKDYRIIDKYYYLLRFCERKLNNLKNGNINYEDLK